MMRRFLIAIALVAVGLLTSIGSSAIFSGTQPVSAQTSPAMPASGTQLNEIDRAFINDAAQAGVGNILIGQLALQRATDPQVKQFAQAEISEQTQVKNDLARIGPSLGVTPPTTPAPKFQAALRRLSQLSGDEFNRAYIDEGGVNAHLENAATFQREAAFGQNPDLLALVNKGLPIIRQHFSTASTVANYRFGQVARRYNGQPNTSGALSPQRNSTPAAQ